MTFIKVKYILMALTSSCFFVLCVQLPNNETTVNQNSEKKKKSRLIHYFFIYCIFEALQYNFKATIFCYDSNSTNWCIFLWNGTLMMTWKVWSARSTEHRHTAVCCDTLNFLWCFAASVFWALPFFFPYFNLPPALHFTKQYFHYWVLVIGWTCSCDRHRDLLGIKVQHRTVAVTEKRYW